MSDRNHDERVSQIAKEKGLSESDVLEKVKKLRGKFSLTELEILEIIDTFAPSKIEQRMAKFSVGEKVKIVKLLDNITSRELIGMVGTVEEIDKLPNGEFNYYVSGHYIHEQELESVPEN